MLSLKGKGVCGGVTLGTLAVLRRNTAAVKRCKVQNAEAEVARFQTARQDAIDKLAELYEKAVADVGKDNAAIFEIHQMMLEDFDYIESVEGIIRTQQVNAEYAVQTTAANFAEIFSSMEDDYMRARAADVKDISNKVLGCLGDGGSSWESGSGSYILAADDLAPSETVQLDKSRVQGFVTAAGSVNSHTAILARTIGIPAVVNTGSNIGEEYDGKLVAVDGYTGEVFVDPDEATLERIKAKMEQDAQHKKLLEELKGKKSITGGGQQVHVYANIGGTGDLASVLANDAEGIGLFRSEFIYLESKDYPTEEQQFEKYKLAAEAMAGKRVIIRTLDIGADKQVGYFGLKKEENPALGYRAIRICLTRPEIFKTQLRALYRASVYGNLGIMFPMITSVKEVERIKEICEEVKAELRSDGIEYSDKIELGIMIETPAAALISDRLAPMVDFFSVGTNDLTQMTFGFSRDDAGKFLASYYDPHHPAVLRLIKLVTENAHKNGAWIGICGELAADTTLTERFLRMGIDELSVSPSFVLKVRDAVRRTDLSE